MKEYCRVVYSSAGSFPEGKDLFGLLVSNFISLSPLLSLISSDLTTMLVIVFSY